MRLTVGAHRREPADTFVLGERGGGLGEPCSAALLGHREITS
jgi:hypothetical protein